MGSSFADDDDAVTDHQKGLGKVSSKPSIISKMAGAKQEQKQYFEERVEDIEQKKSQVFETANALASDFMKIMSDKTLHINKSVINSIEKDFIKKLLQFSIDLNNDPDESSDGMGSTAILSLLLKNCLSFRDRLNSLEYENSQLKIELQKLQIKDKPWISDVG